MKVLLYSNTMEEDMTCANPQVVATGKTVDDLVPQFSDDLALLMDKWPDCDFNLWGTGIAYPVHGENISFADVVEYIATGKCKELTVEVPATDNCEEYRENWTVTEVPDPEYALVKSGKEDSGVLMTPSVATVGTEEECTEKMDEIRKASCEHWDGGNGHWECLDGGGDFVCYDIVKI